MLCQGRILSTICGYLGENVSSSTCRLPRRISTSRVGWRTTGRACSSCSLRPPRWTLAWKAKGRKYEVNLMAFAQGGAWVIHGRTGLDRPFQNLKSVRERDEATIRQEILDQMATDAPSL